MSNRPMKTKSQIVDNWLVRYTGLELESFGEYILLTNFATAVHVCLVTIPATLQQIKASAWYLY